MAPFVLMGAEYGYLITLWRLCAFGMIVETLYVNITPKKAKLFSLVVSSRIDTEYALFL